jgi:O-antigen/teichoic acid export membrane protein
LGVLGVFSALVAVMSVVVPLGYDQAILGARSRSEAMNYLAGALFASLALCMLLAPVLWVGLPMLDGFPHSWQFVPLAVAGTLLAVCTTAAQAWYIRERSITIVGIGAFVNMSSRTLVQIASGAAGAGVCGLVGGEVTGRVLTIAVLDRKRIVLRALRLGWRRPRLIWTQMQQGRTFALFQMPSSALDIVLVWMPLPLVALAYGPEWAGIVTLVQRIGTAPASLIGQSLVQIYHQRAARFAHADRPALLRLTVILFVVVLALFLPIWLVLWFVGPDGFAFVFGENWRNAGMVAAIWAPLVVLQILAQVASRMLILIHRQVVRLIANSVLVIAMPAILLTCAHFGTPPVEALAATVAGNSLIYVVFIGSALWHFRG